MADPAQQTAGTRITAAVWNAEVYDQLMKALNPPRCHVHDSGGTSCVNATATVIDWATEIYDTAAMHGSPSNRVTFPVSGTYHVIVGLGFSPVTYTAMSISIRENSTTAADGTDIRSFAPSGILAAGGQAHFVFERIFTAGDWIQVWVTQTSGANRAMSTQAYGTYIMARQVAIS